MDLLTPPTDNLYKFLAIAGVAIIALTTVVTNGDIQKLRDQSDQLSQETTVLKVKSKIEVDETEADSKEFEALKDEKTTLVKQRERARELAKKIQADIQVGRYNQEALTVMQADQEELKEIDASITQQTAENSKNRENNRQAFEALQQRSQASRITLAEIDAKSGAINRLALLIKIRGVEFAIFNMVGALLAMFGFQLWYVKVQRYQDQMLAAEVAAKLRELETVPSPPGIVDS